MTASFRTQTCHTRTGRTPPRRLLAASLALVLAAACGADQGRKSHGPAGSDGGVGPGAGGVGGAGGGPGGQFGQGGQAGGSALVDGGGTLDRDAGRAADSSADGPRADTAIADVPSEGPRDTAGRSDALADTSALRDGIAAPSDSGPADASPAMDAPGMARLSLAPNPAEFGPSIVGESAMLAVTVTNDGTGDSGPIAAAITGASAAQFKVTGGTCAALTTLAPAASCTVALTFTAAMSGMQAATLTVMATPGGPVTVPVTGIGRTQALLKLDGTSVDFGTVDVGDEAIRMITLRNLGEATSGALDAATLVGAPFTPAAGGTCGAGTRVQAGGSCMFAVRFAPSTNGVFSGTLGTSATPGGAVSINLTGSGRRTYTLEVLRTGTGAGNVTSTPAGIDCGSDCTEPFAIVTTPVNVTLQATPAAGSRFAGWSGACAGTGTCSVSMSQGRHVEAMFTATHTVTVTVSGMGTVTSTSTPTQAQQLNCQPTCAVAFDENASVTLTAAPGAGATWIGWGGQCSGTTTTCTLSITGSRTVSASFGTSGTPVQLAVWPLNGTLDSNNPVAPGTTAANVTAGNLSKGPGLTSPGTFANAFMGSGWPSGLPDDTKYFEFSVTAAPGHTITYDSVRFSLYNAFDGAAAFQLRSSVDNFAPWLDNQGFASGIASPGISVTADAKMLGTRGGTVTFRVYMYNNTGTTDPLVRGFRGSAAGGLDLKVYGVAD